MDNMKLLKCNLEQTRMTKNAKFSALFKFVLSNWMHINAHKSSLEISSSVIDASHIAERRAYVLWAVCLVNTRKASGPKLFIEFDDQQDKRQEPILASRSWIVDSSMLHLQQAGNQIYFWFSIEKKCLFIFYSSWFVPRWWWRWSSTEAGRKRIWLVTRRNR